MILYHEGGSAKYVRGSPSCTSSEWGDLKEAALRNIESGGDPTAACRLRQYPFVLHEGTNEWNDKFSILCLDVPHAIYLEVIKLAKDPDAQRDFTTIARVVGEVCTRRVRFIVVERSTSDALAEPVLNVTSEVVEQALREAQTLIENHGPSSGLDRIHTALHGYLKTLLNHAAIPFPANSGVTDLFRLLRERHPSFQPARPRRADVDRIMRSLAKIIDATNPVRNLGSLAHPNEDLLEEPEAMLVINSVRSLLHYLNARI